MAAPPRPVDQVFQGLHELHAELVDIQNGLFSARADPLKTITPFHGKPGESFRLWLEKTNDAFTAALVDENHVKRLFPLLLRGKAKDRYEALAQAVRTGPYQAMVDALNAAINDNQHISLSRDVLDTLTMNAGESMREFAHRIKQHGSAAFPHLRAAALQLEVKNYFIRKLPPKIRTEVKRRNPQTLEDTLQIAELEEQLEKERAESVNALVHDMETSSIKDEIAALKHEFQVEINKQKQITNNLRNRGQWRGNRGFTGSPSFQTNQRGFWRGNRGGQGASYNNGGRGYYNNRGRGNFQNNNYYPRGRNNRYQFRPWNRGRGNYPQCFAVHEDSNTSSSRPVSPSMSVYGIMFAVCMLGVCVDARVVNDCHQSTIERAVRPPMIPTCIFPPIRNIMTNSTITLFAKKNVVHHSNAFTCRTRKFELCTTGFLKLWKRISVQEFVSEPLTEKECRNLATTRTVNGNTLQKSGTFPDKRWSTSLSVDTVVPWFGQSCENRTVFTLDEGDVYTPDGKHLLSNIGDVNGCETVEGVCIKKHVTTVWDSFHIQISCLYESLGTYPCTIADKIVMIPDTNTIEEVIGDFSQKSNETKCFTGKPLQLKSGLIAVFEVSQKPYELRKKRTVMTDMEQAAQLTSDNLRNETAFLKRKLAELHTQMTIHYRYLQEVVEQKLFAVEADGILGRKALKARLDQLNETRRVPSDLITLDAVQKRLQDHATQVTRDLDFREHRIDVQTEEIAKIKQNLEQFKSEIAKSSDSAQQEKELQSIIRTISTLQNDRKTVELQIVNITTALSTLATKIADVDKRTGIITELQNDRSSVETRIANITAELSALVMKLSDLNRKPNEDISRRLSEAENQLHWICNAQRTRLDSLQNLLLINPTIGMRKYLKRDDIIARKAGDNIYMIAHCKMIEVNETDIFANHEYNGSCYDKVPVLIENQLRFILPNTNDLDTFSETIPCERIPVRVREQDGKWYYGNEAGPSPLEMNALQYQSRTKQFSSQRKARFYETTFTWLSQLSKDIYVSGSEMVDDVWIQIGNSTEMVKESVVKTYDKAKTVIVDTIETIWDWTKWGLIVIGIPLVCLAVLIAMAVLYFKIWFIRKSTSGIADSIKSLGRKHRINTINAIGEEDTTETEELPLSTLESHSSTNFYMRPTRYPPWFTYVPM